MKIKFIYLFAVAIFAYLVLSSQSGGTAFGGGGARTGAPPNEGTCGDCHSGGSYNPIISIRLLDSATGIAVTNYTGGRRYRLEVTITANNALRFGAQATILQTSNDVIAGVLSNPSANARLSNLNGRQYLEQSVTTPSSLGTAVYTASWISPPVGTGSVRIFASGVAANTNGSVLGDNVATGSLLIPEVAPTTIRYPRDSFCLIDVRPVPVITGVAGGVFSADRPGLFFINTTSGQIDPGQSTPGRYEVRYTYNTPPSVVFDTVYIVQQDDGIFLYPDTICKNSQNPVANVPGTRGGIFSCLNPDLVFNTSTGEVDLAATPAGRYSMVYTTPNVCADTQSQDFEIIYVPTATFTYPSRTYCGNTNSSLLLSPPATLFTFDTTQGANTNARGGTYTVQPAGVQVDPVTGEILLNVNPPFGAAGIYQIMYTTTATCPSTASFVVTIESPSTGAISYPDNQYCENASNQGVTIIGAQNGSFFSPTNAAIDFNTGELSIQNSNVGAHIIGYIPLSACADTSFSDTIRIEQRRSVFYEYPSVGYCIFQSNTRPDTNTMVSNSNAYFYLNNSNFSSFINSVTGQFTFPPMPTNADSVIYTIIRRDSFLCGSSDTTNLTVYATGNAHFYYPNDTICDNADAPVIPYIGGVAGGIFSSTPNAFINSSSGAINPDSTPVGQYLITYQSPSPCAATAYQTINFVEADSVWFAYTDYPICIDGGGIPTITSASGSAVAGYFTARPLDTFARNPLVFSDNTTGEIDLRFFYYLANISIPDGEFVGQYEVAYHVLGSCPEILYDTIQLKMCVGVDKNIGSSFEFLLYPNPTQSWLVVQNTDFVGELQIRVSDLLGRVVIHTQQHFQQQTAVDLSSIERGIYLIEIADRVGNKYTQKILKQ